MAVKADESLAVSRKRQEAERLASPTWMAVPYALGGLLVAVASLAFWLGLTLGEMGVSIENNAKAIAQLEVALEQGLERLENKQDRGQERLENILLDILRNLNGDE